MRYGKFLIQIYLWKNFATNTKMCYNCFGDVMRTITKLMINDFKMKKLKYDFMGYTFKNQGDLSFHHLIIPHRESKRAGIGEGYCYWNGAILVQDTSHEYLHIIEKIDPEIFYHISSEMIDENIKRKIEIENLERINDLLCYFEREHCSDVNSRGKILIKERYTNRIMKRR